MAGSLLDIYGLYDQALQRYMNEANAYNAAGQAWNKSVEDYNASIISDPALYQGVIGDVGFVKGYTTKPGNYSGSGPYTIYNGYTLGRTGAPISTYQTDIAGYNTETDYDTITGYDDYGNPTLGTKEIPYYAGTNETTYVDPVTGLASVYAARPSASFDMVAPVAPNEPPAQTVTSTLGNIDPTQLYQTLFGKGTPDIMSNEAWALQNVSTPFLSPETSAYETGGVNRMNNPLYYAGPDSLTTGQIGQDVNSYISGQQTGNVYY